MLRRVDRVGKKLCPRRALSGGSLRLVPHDSLSAGIRISEMTVGEVK
jgi:hypothetical protein